ncbi:hypothetical protein ACQUW5_00910 [Legionella sp. CNM-1927-20]|uniref:hypothetical protein n=1 Tax=Legionella sp. CNM-1927-20 TaxID=3422221 RepID=UPI00403A8126
MQKRFELQDNPSESTSSTATSEVQIKEASLDQHSSEPAYTSVSIDVGSLKTDPITDSPLSRKRGSALSEAADSASVVKNTVDANNCNENNIKKTKNINKDEVKHPLYVTNGMRGQSFVVLDEQSVAILGGRTPYPSNLSNRFLLPQPTPYTGTNPYNTAYLAFNALLTTKEGIKKPVQVIFMRGINQNGQSWHDSIGEQARLWRKELLEHGIVIPDWMKPSYSGECKGDLTEDDFVQNVLGHRLAGIEFNLKGTLSDRYRNKGGTQKEEEIPALVTHIPLELLMLNSEYDEVIRRKMQPPNPLNRDGEKISSSTLTANIGLFAGKKEIEVNSGHKSTSTSYGIEEKDNHLVDNNDLIGDTMPQAIK